MRFLFVDRITALSVGQSIRGIKHITPDDHFLVYDESGKLSFVSTFIGEALGQLAAWNVMCAHDFLLRPVAGIANSARLYRPAFVGETLQLESQIDALDDTVVQYHSTAKVGDETIFTIDGALGPLLPMEDFIDRHEILRQFAEIHRPFAEGPLVKNASESLIPTEIRTTPTFGFDRLLFSEPGVSLCAEKGITRAAAYFPDHFPNKPVLPMTVLLECQINLAREF
ncbi:MAG: hydroxymyristoyl-ACP dehydratase, partial [Legionellales bacterium]|nr:hydroxymyristoyl-ACP dehydratase [Legionellales bacterium]